MYQRNITAKIGEALSNSSIVFLRGPKGCGKSALAKTFCQDGARSYFSLDSIFARSAALDDARNLIRFLKKPIVFDEIQKAPNLIQYIKADAQIDHRRGQWLMTGSANSPLLSGLDALKDSHARAIDMGPLSQSELIGQKADFITRVFQPRFMALTEPWSRERLFEALCSGGFPAAIARTPAKRRTWIDSYLSSLVERETRELFNALDLRGVATLIKLLGPRTATSLNFGELCRAALLNGKTISRYMALLETVFLIWTLPPFSDKRVKEAFKAPKIHFTDSAIACHLNRVNVKNWRRDPLLAGRLMESFVVSEIQRQAAWSETNVSLSHYRSLREDEVDLILTHKDGRVVAIDVKFSLNVTDQDTMALYRLRAALDYRFSSGLIIYAGHEFKAVGDRFYAVPIGEIFAPA
jgi:predicted AAA+ superfamily ATPase